MTKTKFPRRQFLLLAMGAAALLVVSGFAWSQAYPSRPVRIIVPFPPGGSTDVAARLIAESLSRSLGRQAFVENLASDGSNIGLEAAARSSPDGYTFLVTTDWVAGAAHVSKLSIDPLKDLVPVIYVSRLPVVLAVHPSLAVNSIAELIALAKQQPGLNYVIGGGTGNEQHFVAEWFAQIAGIKLAHVPYRGGGQAINDLIAGHVKIGSLGSTPVIPHYKAGTLRLLAQSTAARSSSLPDVLTYQEAGINGLVPDQWHGVFVPVGTPPTIAAGLNAEINKVVADSAVRESFFKQGQEPIGGTAEDFAQFFRGEYAKYERLSKELNIKAE
jgi:tripartite-type tricarboxylate transporter receptor subunit TctC